MDQPSTPPIPASSQCPDEPHLSLIPNSTFPWGAELCMRWVWSSASADGTERLRGTIWGCIPTIAKQALRCPKFDSEHLSWLGQRLWDSEVWDYNRNIFKSDTGSRQLMQLVPVPEGFKARFSPTKISCVFALITTGFLGGGGTSKAIQGIVFCIFYVLTCTCKHPCLKELYMI